MNHEETKSTKAFDLRRRVLRAKDARGYTFIELLVVSTIILIMASAVMPLAKVTATRQREAELRRDLREIRTAIDKYKDAADLGLISPLDLKIGNEGYPASLETLVEGVRVPNDATGRKLVDEAVGQRELLGSRYGRRHERGQLGVGRFLGRGGEAFRQRQTPVERVRAEHLELIRLVRSQPAV